MRPVSPRIDGLDETMVAEDQGEFKPLAVARTEDVDGDPCMVTRWKPNDDERRAVSPFALPGQSAQKGGGAE